MSYQERIQESGARIQHELGYNWRMYNRRFCTPTKFSIWWSSIPARSEFPTD